MDSCKFCGTDTEAVGFEIDYTGERICDECIYSMTDQEYGVIVIGPTSDAARALAAETAAEAAAQERV